MALLVLETAPARASRSAIHLGEKFPACPVSGFTIPRSSRELFSFTPPLVPVRLVMVWAKSLFFDERLAVPDQNSSVMTARWPVAQG